MKRHTARVSNNPASPILCGPGMREYRASMYRRDCLGWAIACGIAAALLCAVLVMREALQDAPDVRVAWEVAK